MVPKMVNIRLTKFRYDSTWFKIKTSYRKHCVNCPNADFFLVRIFLYSDWIRRFLCKSPYSIRIKENKDQKKLNFHDNFHAEKKFTIMQTQSNFVNINVDLARSFNFKILLRK